MIIRRLTDIIGAERDVAGPTFNSRRLLLADDGMGFSMHDTVLYAGTETEMHYQNHVEAVYCIEGEAELTELDSGTTHKLEPGVLYALDDHDRHILRAITDFRAVCIFNPPITGAEVHDENGVYPLIVEGEEKS
ncbi:MAG: ectoine synthase [Acidimicrobiia bacterium]